MSEKYRSSVGSCNRQFSSLYSNRIREFTRLLLIPHLNESVAPATVHGSMQDCAAIRGQGFHLKIWIPYVISKWSSAQGQTLANNGACNVINAMATTGDGFNSTPSPSRSVVSAGVGIVHRLRRRLRYLKQDRALRLRRFAIHPRRLRTPGNSLWSLFILWTPVVQRFKKWPKSIEFQAEAAPISCF